MNDFELAIAVASKITGVAKSTIVSPSRKWPAVEARMIVILLLNRQGMTDEHISWALNRKRATVTKCRHTALGTLQYSKVFQGKLNSSIVLYDKEKSLRMSQD